MKKQNTKQQEKIETSCADILCPIHGEIALRGKSFRGKVIRKFAKRVTIEFDRTLYIKKYERYAKRKTKLHARLPECMSKEIQIGDYIEIYECRPISKITHFIVSQKLKSGENIQ